MLVLMKVMVTSLSIKTKDNLFHNTFFTVNATSDEVAFLLYPKFTTSLLFHKLEQPFEKTLTFKTI